MGKGMRAGKKKKVGGAGNMQKQLQQMQVVQQQMESMQSELEAKEFETTSGGGAVKVKINGAKEVLAIDIDKEVVDPEDVEMLQDLIVAALNEAMRQVDEVSENEMGKLTGGLNIPGLV